MAYRWVILIVGMLAYMTSYFARSNHAGIAKLLSSEFAIDKGSFGLLGSSFLYAYALAQLPWGIASDKWGSRKAVGFGVLLTGATLWGFATSTSFHQLVFWRIASGVAAASIYVAMAGALSRWFAPEQRGFGQTVFAAVGGTGGEATANVVLPFLAVQVASGWRQSTDIVAALIVAVALVCALFLRSTPPGQKAAFHKPFDFGLLKDAQLWSFTMVYTGSIVSLRLFPIWLPLYAADIFVSRGLSLKEATLAAVPASSMYLAGRLVGPPTVGLLSDRFARGGILRAAVAFGFLLLSASLFMMMPLGMETNVALYIIAFLMGVSINMYPLVTTAVSETFGAERTGSVMGFVNMFAQLAGATALAISGYLGIALNSSPGNALTEYRGVWLVGIVGCLGAAGLAFLIPVVSRLFLPVATKPSHTASSGSGLP